MGLFSFLKKKKVTPVITEEDSRELAEMQRVSYMDEARKIIVDRGKQKAREDLTLKKKEWDLS